MKHLRKCETLIRVIVAALIASVALAPMLADAVMAQSGGGRTAPVISHLPSAVGIRGRPLTILAHIGGESGVASVTLTLFSNGQEIPGRLPERPGEGTVPVRAIALEDLMVRSGPGDRYRSRGRVSAGVEMEVTQVRDGHYRIQTTGGVRGYVESAKTRIQLSGRAYGAALPASMTETGTLSYRITAVDVNGNSSSTPTIGVRLLSAQEIAALRAGRRPAGTAAAGTQGGSGWKKIAVISGLALLGGGAYLLLSQKEEEESAVINVTVDWD